MTSANTPLVAKAGTWYRVARYIMAALLLLFGILFIKDGFFTYPKEQRAYDIAASNGQNPQGKKHTDFDILLQKLLGISLPPLAAATLAWTLYKSRGVYRLDGNRLSLPGHPTVTLEQIVRVDRRLWDRKGIALLYYVLPDGTEVRARMDDFMYERDATDDIFDRIQASITADQGETADEENPGQESDGNSDDGGEMAASPPVVVIPPSASSPKPASRQPGGPILPPGTKRTLHSPGSDPERAES